LETLPELPSTLQQLRAELPIYYEEAKELQHGGQMIYNGLWPDMVAAVNSMVVRAAEYSHQQSKKRCTTRCSTYKEQIMMKAWHPSRVEKLIEMGYDIEDM
jgi:hypothetical protein